MVAIRAAAVTVEPNGSTTASTRRSARSCSSSSSGPRRAPPPAGSEPMLAKVGAEHYPALRGREGEKIWITWKEDDAQLLDA